MPGASRRDYPSPPNPQYSGCKPKKPSAKQSKIIQQFSFPDHGAAAKCGSCKGYGKLLQDFPEKRVNYSGAFVVVRLAFEKVF